MAGQFPADFLWGASTSAYQVEGATRTGGRGETTWDRFVRSPGRIADGGTGDVACDSYGRYPEDIALLTQMGCTAYLFSTAWARVYPEGYGRLNRDGLDYYERLVDALLAAGVQPVLTLYHWDLPQALQARGGWLNRDTISAFAQYADTMSRRLGDRVRRWVTINEPETEVSHGYLTGEHAPGIRNRKAALQVGHHLLVAHGEAIPVLRGNGPADTQIGAVLGLVPAYPASDRAEDERAATRQDGVTNRWYLDPIFAGRYPDDLLERYAADAPETQTTDMAKIARPLDFLGVGYSTRNVVRDDPAPPLHVAPAPPDGVPRGGNGAEVYPEGLYDALTRVHRDYAPPAIHVTGNGVVDNTGPDDTRAINDRLRLDYLRGHVPQLLRAIDAGVPLRGYFHRSLLDNFEWNCGYTMRFGLAYTDYSTGDRTLKESGHWYTRLIADNEARDV